jgi:aryl-alcohol dehydrogenase-like predicted oxidoreductase
MPAFERRILGRTNLTVSPLGIGGGSSLSSADTLYAFDRGVNYFFFSTDLHHCFYQKSGAALKTLCTRGSRSRSQVVLATVSYVNDPEKLMAVMVDQFGELGIDYIDVFHWGWITDQTDCARLLACAPPLKEPGPFADMVRQLMTVRDRIDEVNDALVTKGLVRFVGASFHSRAVAARHTDGALDVLMLRYNIGHTGVERDVFPRLTGDKSRDPGIVVFNTTHEGQTFFSDRPSWYPEPLPVPKHGDSYRFALSNPLVDVVLTGPANREQLDQALAAVAQGPLADDHMTFMRRYGHRCREPIRKTAARAETGGVDPARASV